MKILCDVCERSEATVLCCADEAALCWQCDGVVHAANKLARKHQRVPLLPRLNPPSSSSDPLCDICQEKAGYFFCLEDRALLCRNCDVAIHTATPYVSKHQRFLITGVRVAVQQYLASYTNNSSSTSHGNSSDNNNISCQIKMPPKKEKNSKITWKGFGHDYGEADVLRSPWG
ncbi:B-box zinc finger family protein [Rhynchospora pubera]|uniref:B-box zinc finger family protein n=1 Tax=Rhynchospora pubera TaxID=906938 RepID=A0AAV8FXS1_9POAL|nr:B-box zinc finger family protein [Rhynchospora pubera]